MFCADTLVTYRALLHIHNVTHLFHLGLTVFILGSATLFLIRGTALVLVTVHLVKGKVRSGNRSLSDSNGHFRNVNLVVASSITTFCHRRNHFKTIGGFFGYLYGYSGIGIIVEVPELLVVRIIEVLRLLIIRIVEVYEFLIIYTVGVIELVIIRIVEVFEFLIIYSVEVLEIVIVHLVEVLIGAQAGSWPGATSVEHGTAINLFFPRLHYRAFVH